MANSSGDLVVRTLRIQSVTGSGPLVMEWYERPCVTCGMLATVDPELHTERYGHAPQIREHDGVLDAVFRWTGIDWANVDAGEA